MKNQPIVILILKMFQKKKIVELGLVLVNNLIMIIKICKKKMMLIQRKCYKKIIQTLKKGRTQEKEQ